ncbi:MAG: sortase, partial [Chloroflexota bacterium]
MKLSRKEIFIEQTALLMASFVWTLVVLFVISLFWVYQDVQARWEFVLNAPPEVLAQADGATPTPTITPTATVWAGPGVSPTPTSTKPPTPLPTRVLDAPAILPETPNENDESPLEVIVHTEDEAAEFGLEESDAPPVEAVDGTEAVDGLQPTRLIIESVNIDSTIIPVGWQTIEQNGQSFNIWQVADNAIGWHKTTAHLGYAGNTVMAGHHNVKGEVFRDLVNVEVGDTVIAYSGGQRFEYVIDVKTIVKEKG